MDEVNLANKIAEKVISDTQFWIALVGIAGAIVGSILTLFGNMAFHWYKGKPNRDLEKTRKRILEQMLEDERFPDKWRNLSTLSSVIGTDDQETKRLLIMCGARASEKADNKWSMIKNNPLPSDK